MSGRKVKNKTSENGSQKLHDGQIVWQELDGGLWWPGYIITHKKCLHVTFWGEEDEYRIKVDERTRPFADDMDVIRKTKRKIGQMKMKMKFTKDLALARKLDAKNGSGSQAPPSSQAPPCSPKLPSSQAPPCSPKLPSSHVPPCSPKLPSSQAPPCSPELPSSQAPPCSPQLPSSQLPSSQVQPSTPELPSSQVPRKPGCEVGYSNSKEVQSSISTRENVSIQDSRSKSDISLCPGPTDETLSIATSKNILVYPVRQSGVCGSRAKSDISLQIGHTCRKADEPFFISTGDNVLVKPQESVGAGSRSISDFSSQSDPSPVDETLSISTRDYVMVHLVGQAGNGNRFKSDILQSGSNLGEEQLFISTSDNVLGHPAGPVGAGSGSMPDKSSQFVSSLANERLSIATGEEVLVHPVGQFGSGSRSKSDISAQSCPSPADEPLSINTSDDIVVHPVGQFGSGIKSKSDITLQNGSSPTSEPLSISTSEDVRVHPVGQFGSRDSSKSDIYAQSDSSLASEPLSISTSDGVLVHPVGSVGPGSRSISDFSSQSDPSSVDETLSISTRDYVMVHLVEQAGSGNRFKSDISLQSGSSLGGEQLSISTSDNVLGHLAGPVGAGSGSMPDKSSQFVSSLANEPLSIATGEDVLVHPVGQFGSGSRSKSDNSAQSCPSPADEPLSINTSDDIVVHPVGQFGSGIKSKSDITLQNGSSPASEPLSISTSEDVLVQPVGQFGSRDRSKSDIYAQSDSSPASEPLSISTSDGVLVHPVGSVGPGSRSISDISSQSDSSPTGEPLSTSTSDNVLVHPVGSVGPGSKSISNISPQNGSSPASEPLSISTSEDVLVHPVGQFGSRDRSKSDIYAQSDSSPASEPLSISTSDGVLVHPVGSVGPGSRSISDISSQSDSRPTGEPLSTSTSDDVLVHPVGSVGPGSKSISNISSQNGSSPASEPLSISTSEDDLVHPVGQFGSRDRSKSDIYAQSDSSPASEPLSISTSDGVLVHPVGSVGPGSRSISDISSQSYSSPTGEPLSTSTSDDVLVHPVGSVGPGSKPISNISPQCGASPAGEPLPISTSDDVLFYPGGQAGSDRAYFSDAKGIFFLKPAKSLVGQKGQVKKSQRVFDNRAACLYCGKLLLKVADHWITKHRDESEVQALIAIESIDDMTECGKKQERMKQITLLRNKGNSKHNSMVKMKGVGQLILSRRPTGSDTHILEKYKECPSCFAWVADLVKHRSHTNRCINSDGKISRRALEWITEPQASGIVTTEATDMLKKECLYKMSLNDPIAKVAKEDSLLIQMGNDTITKNCKNPLKRGRTASDKIRLTSRLLISIRKKYPRITLDECLKPDMYNIVVDAVKDVSGGRASTYDTPSNATKLGHHLKEIAEIKMARAEIEKSTEKRKEAKAFLFLMQRRWLADISAVASATLTERNFNSMVSFPTPEDIMTLTTYLRDQANKVKSIKNAVEYIHAIEIVQVRLLTYNRRRPGELESVTLESYQKRPSTQEAHMQEYTHDLTKLERNLVQSQEVFNVRGKRGKPVPIIIPSDVKHVVDLIQNDTIREMVGVGDSPYLFPKISDPLNRVVSAAKSLAKFCQSSGISHPERVTATVLRKYIATMVQVMCLSSAEMEWVASHLGHSLDIEKTYYRISSTTIEKAKIAKLLMLADAGQVHHYKGKSLDDIDFDEVRLPEDVYTESEDTVATDTVDNDSVTYKGKRKDNQRTSHDISEESVPSDAMASIASDVITLQGEMADDPGILQDITEESGLSYKILEMSETNEAMDEMMDHSQVNSSLEQMSVQNSACSEKVSRVPVLRKQNDKRYCEINESREQPDDDTDADYQPSRESTSEETCSSDEEITFKTKPLKRPKRKSGSARSSLKEEIRSDESQLAKVATSNENTGWTQELRVEYNRIFSPVVQDRMLRKPEILLQMEKSTLLSTFSYLKVKSKILADVQRIRRHKKKLVS